MSVVAGMGAAWLAADAQRPHIILLMTDQQRFDAMGCTSGGTVVSPHLDRLAAEGTLFENAYTSCPSSTPARAGLLTGLSPWHHGLLGYGKVAEHYRYEMPQMLREQGYFTFGIGKMHWFPQRTKHGFHGTLLDESGRTEDPNFTSDYRQWFQLHAPGGNPDATGVGWNAHGARDYQLDERLHPDQIIGVDLSEGMLRIAREKAARRSAQRRILFEVQDCLSMDFGDNTFDVVTVAYGVRNFEHLEAGFREMHRVLRPGGVLCVIELSTPEHFPFRQLYKFYTYTFIPFIGRLVSKDRSAYSYLPRSVAAVPQGGAMLDIFLHAGFSHCYCRRLTFGACTIYIGEKKKE